MKLLFPWNQSYYFSMQYCNSCKSQETVTPREVMCKLWCCFSFSSLLSTSPTMLWKENWGHCVLHFFPTLPYLKKVINCKGLYNLSLELCYKSGNSVLGAIPFHRPVGLLRRYKACLTYKWLENERRRCKMETQSSQRIIS